MKNFVFVFLQLLVATAAFPQAPAPQPNTSPTPAKDFELNTVLMQTTFYIEGNSAQGQPVLGTVFVMGRPLPEQKEKGAYVLITAAHVLADIATDTAVVGFRIKINDTWTRFPVPIQIRLKGTPLWTKHPNADVAAMYIRLPNQVALPLLSTDILADDAVLAKFEIHPGDELECLGYPLGQSANDAGFPILRSGKIASYPLLPTASNPTFLYDFHIFKGNSGGPVYFVQSGRLYQNVFHAGENIHFVVGLVSQESLMQQQISGFYSEETRQLQLGLAVVVQANFIKQTIEMLPAPSLN
jgi:hypothetical protein